jgi:hypothetical protein
MAIHEATDRGALVVDVTSRGPEPWGRFSPFYPHGNIPAPLSPGYMTASVEGAWPALKLFERADVDLTKLARTDMRHLKRPARSYGRVLGHRAGVGSPLLVGYVEARKQIYLPLYQWVLDHRLPALVGELRELSRRGDIVLLDYATNGDVGTCRRRCPMRS